MNLKASHSPKTMKWIFVFAASYLVLALGYGVVHGRYTGRWVPLPSLENYTQRLPNVPMRAGEWAATDLPLDEEELSRSGIHGHLYRQYRSRKTGESLSLLIVCGRPGPISVHTPDICYRDAGYTAVGEAEKRTIRFENRTAEFWRLRFRPPGRATGRELEIYWAWASDKGFVAPDNPRIAFAGQPALYKVYVVRESIAVGSQPQSRLEPELFESLFPQLEAVLVAPFAPGS